MAYYAHSDVAAWSKRHNFTLRMASCVLSGANGQALVGYRATLRALVRRGLALESPRHANTWCLTEAGKSLIAELTDLDAQRGMK